MGKTVRQEYVTFCDRISYFMLGCPTLDDYCDFRSGVRNEYEMRRKRGEKGLPKFSDALTRRVISLSLDCNPVLQKAWRDANLATRVTAADLAITCNTR
ncbi:MAG: hypothetical protein Q7R56_01255 [Nanoarchaeota archaeon]|nr:hypothetical protein [Nanoarchaeota archaeon]